MPRQRSRSRSTYQPLWALLIAALAFTVPFFVSLFLGDRLTPLQVKLYESMVVPLASVFCAYFVRLWNKEKDADKR